MTSFPTLREANIVRDSEWDPEHKINLAFRYTELAGEVGELGNLIKKILREQAGMRGTRANHAELREEIADVAICLDLLAMHLRIDLPSAIVEKFNKTSEKYGLTTRLAP